MRGEEDAAHGSDEEDLGLHQEKLLEPGVRDLQTKLQLDALESRLSALKNHLFRNKKDVPAARALKSLSTKAYHLKRRAR